MLVLEEDRVAGLRKFEGDGRVEEEQTRGRASAGGLHGEQRITSEASFTQERVVWSLVWQRLQGKAVKNEAVATSAGMLQRGR